MTIEEANAALFAGADAPQPETIDRPGTIAEANAALGFDAESSHGTIAEANAALGIKPKLGIRERLKLEKQAQTGKVASDLDLLPVLGGIRQAEQNRQEAMEQKLFSGEYRDTLEASRYALSLGIPQEEVRRINGLGDDAAIRKGFSDAVKDRFAARIRSREEAQRKLQGAKEAGTLEKIASGTITGGAMVAEFANPLTMAAGTAGKIINSVGGVGKDIYILDKKGKPVLAKDENGNDLRGDRSEWAAAKAIAGGYAEQTIWTAMGIKQLGSIGVKLIDKIPGVNKLAAATVGKISGTAEKIIGEIASTEGGRIALKTGEVIGKVNDKLHFGSLPDMIYKTRLTELTQNVMGMGVREEDRQSFGQWLDDFTSVEENAELLTGIIGIHLLTAGYGALKARGAERAFRHLDANGMEGGREEVVAEYIGAEKAKQLSDVDLDNIYRLVTSPDLTEAKINDFLDKMNRDQAEAQKKISAGESISSVIEGIREKMSAGSQGVKTAAERIKETLENKAKLTPEMEDALDGKIAEYTQDIGTSGGAVAKMVKDDILANVKDNAVYEQPDMLDELVAMSMRKFNGEGRRLRIHDVRGEKNAGEQLKTINELGITSWEQAEAEGLVTRDKYGRIGGGARRALNIALHGTEKLQKAVKDGTISGELAEDLMTAAQCELGARPVEEQTALVDGILDRANGDEALARRMLKKLEAESGRESGRIDERLDQIAEEAKVDAIKERNGAADETARGAAVEPVETEDGQIKTVGDVVDSGSAAGQTAEPKPTTALRGAEQADRLAGTKLTVFNGTTMGCETFPEAKVNVSADGVTVRGLTADTMAKPENVADVAAFMTHLMRISKRNGIRIEFEDADAAKIAQALVTEISQQGAAKTMAKLETRGKLFGLLFKTTLGNGVTYDEASFKEALKNVNNGRQFVDNHGDVYGFVDGNGVLHFNPATFNMDTPIHEYGHLALEATKKINNALWKKGNDLIRSSRYYAELVEEAKNSASPYHGFSDELLCDEALARMIGDRGAKLIEEKGLDAQLKNWLKDVWKAFKGALGIADLTEEQIERMTVGDFVDTINAELLKGGEFGTKKRTPPSQKSIRRFDEDQNSGSNGVLRWKNDRGYLFAIPVDMERTQPGGKVVFATDDANITDWIQNALNGYELRLSKSGKLYVKGRDGLPDELADIFGRYPTIGQNDGIYDEFAATSGGVRYDTPEALVDALRNDRANYDAWTQGRDAEAEHWAMEAERAEWEAQQRWENSGMSVMDYIRSRVEEGDPEFDLDWETAREMEHDRAMGRFAIKRSANGEEYSYAALSTKPDMTLTPIDPNRFKNYGNKNGRKISDAKKSIIDAGGFVRDGHYYITLDGEEVEVGSRAITHGIHNLNNEMIFPVLGNVIKNAVKVNELNVREKFSGKGQKDENVNAKFVYLGAAAYGNEILPVRIQIDQRNGFKKIESYDVLKSFNTKIGRIASQNKNAPLGVSISPNAPATISIANLIGIAQPLHPQIFSRDVANALGVPYRGNEIQAKFSIGGLKTAGRSPVLDADFKKLEKEFGTTHFMSEAGYILPNGKLLDQSGRKQGYRGTDHSRHLDHRELTDVIARTDGNDAMQDVIASGAIRIGPESGVIDLGNIPNPKQKDVLWDFIDKFNGEVTVDFRLPNGNNDGGASYREGTSARRIFQDIEKYFADGTLPEGTDNGLFSVGRGTAEPDLAFDPSMIVYNPKLKAMGEMEQNAGGIAAAIEKKEALRPWTRKDSPCDLAKPIAMDCADMVQLFRAVSGSVKNPIIRKGEHIPGRPNAIGLNRGGTQIELANRLFGMVDASDVGKLKTDCANDGYFRHENPDWCAAQTKNAVKAEAERSQDELDRRTRELIRHRVATGEGGMHYATQVLGHEIGHTIATLPADRNLGAVGNAMRTLYDALQREMKRAADPLRVKKGEPNLTEEIDNLITWWHGADTLPDYYKKPKEKFAELFGIFLTQPESVHREAPKAYEAIVQMMGKNERLALAYRRITEAKWSGKSNERVMADIEKTWTKEQQEQFRELERLAREPISKARDWFNFALNDRFGPMFAISQRSLAAEKKHLARAVKEGAMSQQEANDRIKARQDEIDALKTALFDWQRQTGGSTRLMMADLDDVIRTAQRDGVNWNDVRMYAHLNRVIELGGRATAHGVDPSRAAAMLGDMARKLGSEKWTKVEKTWKAYRAVYERHALEDPNVAEMFDAETNKMLYANKHYVTMKHRMGAEETAEWLAKVEAYKKGNQDAWDPTIDLWNRMNRGLKGQSGINAGFKLYRLEGSFEATEDPIAATMKTAIDLKENAARNHLLKTMSQTLRDLGVKGVYDTALADGAKEHAVDPNVYERLTYLDGGITHELIVPRVIGASFTTRRSLPRAVDFIGGTMRFLRNTMTLWNPAFINRAYLIDKAALETNIKGLHKPAIDILSEALCFRGIGVPLYMANNYLTRFTPIANTWLGKILWNEHTVNHYAHRAQKIARMVYEGRFTDRLEDARKLRELGRTGEATEIEQNVAIAREMLKKNVFQSLYEFNVKQGGLNTAEILEKFGYQIEGGQNPKSWRGRMWERTKNGARIYNRFEEEQEAVTKIVAYLYRMKMDEQAGRTSAKDADARARLVIEQGGTPNLSARGVFASAIENATGFFWNVRKEGFLRTIDALKDHPTEWIAKNFAQTAMPALLKGLIATGCAELLIRKFFDDDEEKIKESWWAPAVLDHCRFVNSAMKCVPGYYQRNYNVIPIAKFGNEVLSMRVKYSPEEFAIQNAIHTAMQKFGADPTDPSADWSTLKQNMMMEFLPNIFGQNYALDAIGALVGPLVGINPYDQYRERKVYDENIFRARAKMPGRMAKEMVKSFWNYSPL